ncbi:M14 family zinc carboxypeptidase [Allohahella marinimesophila]|uniref:Proprotein convertase P-domain-containing protein n=1 Tax=Allohahella marinimesophila TaxID=1054972 RepID=A0ABP7P1W1_9GAMM
MTQVRLRPLSYIIMALTAGAVLPLEVAAHDDLNHLAAQEQAAADTVYKVHFPNLKLARKAAISFHANLLASHYDGGYLIMELSESEQDKLRRFGFTFEPATEWLAKRSEVLSTMQEMTRLRQELRSSAVSGSDPAMAQDVMLRGIPGFECYETVEETFAVAADLVTTYPALASWIDVGNSWEKNQGLGGHDIRVLKLTNRNTGGEKPILFINSAIHAREFTTAPLTLDFARTLLNGYGTDADLTWILDHHEVHLMLQTNPDGRKKAETGLLWRKNANQNYCGASSNKRGADLNRNFTFGWNSANGSSGSQCNDTYRGPRPGSEPETQAIENYVRSIFPDRRGSGRNDAAPTDTSGIHLDIHSYSELVLWPWGDTNSAAPNGRALQTLGRKFAWFNGYTPQQSIGLYPTDGTSDGVSYGELGVAAYTFELGTDFFQSCSVYDGKIKPDNLRALIYAAKVVRTPYVTPAGPDVTSLGISADATAATLTASVTDTRFSNRNGSEPVQTIAQAEYYIDVPPWEAGAEPVALATSDGGFDERTEQLTGSIDTSGLTEGKHTVFVRARDAAGNWGAVSAAFLEVGEGSGGGDNGQYEYASTNPQAIPDRGTISSQIAIPEEAPAASSATVSVTIDHTYQGDIRLTLAKGGRSVVVKNSSNRDNSRGSRTYTASVSASQFNGLSGAWTLTVQDVYTRDVGTLTGWKLTLNQ